MKYRNQTAGLLAAIAAGILATEVTDPSQRTAEGERKAVAQVLFSHAEGFETGRLSVSGATEIAWDIAGVEDPDNYEAPEIEVGVIPSEDNSDEPQGLDASLASFRNLKGDDFETEQQANDADNG